MNGLLVKIVIICIVSVLPVLLSAQGTQKNMMKPGEKTNMMMSGEANYSVLVKQFLHEGMMGADHRANMKFMMLAHMADNLNLTKDQFVKAMDIEIATETELSPLRKQLMEKMKQLFSVWSVEKLDEGVIIKSMREYYEIQNQIKEQTVLGKVKFFNLLTPEQRKKAFTVEMMSEDMMGNMMKPGMGKVKHGSD